MSKEVKYNSDYVDGHMRSLKIEDETLALRASNEKVKVIGDLAVEGKIDTVNTNLIKSGEDGDINVESTRAINLNSATGNFHMLNNGVEFSKDGDAFAGMVLGYTRIQNNGTASADNAILLTGTMTVLQTNQSTNVGVTFTAPPSGNVEIVMSCFLYTSSTTVGFALSDNSTFNEINEIHTYDNGSYRMDETDLNTADITWAVTGLTAGTSYTYYIGGKETVSSTGTIYHGRFRSTGKFYPPIIVKAIALPSNITTGE